MSPYRRRRPSIAPYERPKWVLGGAIEIRLPPWIVKVGDRKVVCPGKIITINVVP